MNKITGIIRKKDLKSALVPVYFIINSRSINKIKL